MDDSALKITESLVKFIEQDFQQRDNSFALLRAVLVNKPDLRINQNALSLCDVDFPIAELGPKTLTAIHKLIVLQQRRKDLFHESLSPLYTIQFSHFVLNTHIDTILSRATLAAKVVKALRPDPSQARDFVLQLREEFVKFPAITRHIDTLVN